MGSGRRERAGYRVERQLLALVSLFALVALAALGSIALEVLPMPVWVYAGSVGVAFVITAWLMVRLLRRRFALLNRLEQLTRHIIRGDYAHRVTVKDKDEFQSL
ncbi:MAG: hypothetical protein AAGE43_09540, partial [Pseudomonadota bacterium]